MLELSLPRPPAMMGVWAVEEVLTEELRTTSALYPDTSSRHTKCNYTNSCINPIHFRKSELFRSRLNPEDQKRGLLYKSTDHIHVGDFDHRHARLTV